MPSTTVNTVTVHGTAEFLTNKSPNHGQTRTNGNISSAHSNCTTLDNAVSEEELDFTWNEMNQKLPTPAHAQSQEPVTVQGDNPGSTCSGSCDISSDQAIGSIRDEWDEESKCRTIPRLYKQDDARGQKPFSTPAEVSGQATGFSGDESNVFMPPKEQKGKVNSNVPMHSASATLQDNFRSRGSSVDQPHDNDVLCGLDSHIGNIQFFCLINANKEGYHACSTKSQQNDICRRIVNAIRNFNPPGHFLEATTPDGTHWHDIGDSHAVEKAHQAFQEGKIVGRYDLSQISLAASKLPHSLSGSPDKDTSDSINPRASTTLQGPPLVSRTKSAPVSAQGGLVSHFKRPVTAGAIGTQLRHSAPAQLDDRNRQTCDSTSSHIQRESTKAWSRIINSSGPRLSRAQTLPSADQIAAEMMSIENGRESGNTGVGAYEQTHLRYSSSAPVNSQTRPYNHDGSSSVLKDQKNTPSKVGRRPSGRRTVKLGAHARKVLQPDQPNALSIKTEIMKILSEVTDVRVLESIRESVQRTIDEALAEDSALKQYKRSSSLPSRTSTSENEEDKKHAIIHPRRNSLQEQPRCTTNHDKRGEDSSLPSTTYDDILTVFQASPLAYIRGENKQVSALDDMSIDLSLEEDTLTKALREGHTKVEIVVEPATTQRLGSFLAKGEGRVMHITCHAYEDALALDNGFGILQYLSTDELTSWIQAGGKNLHFVFVSACDSALVGEAFIRAGLKHVVCCDSQLNDRGAIEFTGAFYQALVCGRLLSDAFRFAQYQVEVSTSIPLKHRKFSLLPKGGNHDVPVFMQNTRTYSGRLKSQHAKMRWIPRPPDVFEGRKLEMSSMLKALNSSRMIHVTGSEGIGKAALTKAVCRRLQRVSPSEEILWMPTIHVAEEDTVCFHLMQVYSLLKSDELSSSELRDHRPYQDCLRSIMSRLSSDRPVIVVNAKDLCMSCPKSKVCTFLEDLLEAVPQVRIIVIHSPGNEILVDECPCFQKLIHLLPLDLESTVSLFGRLCRHVSDRRSSAVQNADDLCGLLLPHETCARSHGAGSKRSRIFYEMLGKGNPKQIHHIAKTMSAADYDKLIRIGQRRERIIQVSSRAALEKLNCSCITALDEAIRVNDMERARGLQEDLEEIELLFEDLPDLQALMSMREILLVDKNAAVNSEDFDTASKLQTELVALDDKIKAEKDACQQSHDN